jgi:hypothetical protein
MQAKMNGWSRTVRAAALALAAVVAPAAYGAPCAGFTDVEDTDVAFCPSVEWLKNRSITLGCTATEYCPSNAVSRLAMAAFMKRLGDALTPIKRAVDLRPAGVALGANVVVCQTEDLNVTGFPRTAYADFTLGATAAADLSFAADLVVSTDGGANWTPLNTNANRGSAPANQWGNVSDIGARDLDVGQTVRFGALVTRGGSPGSADLTDTRCMLRVLVYSRTGGASPY